MPAARASVLMSFMRTGTSVSLAMSWAMPPPMVPAPSTAAARISCGSAAGQAGLPLGLLGQAEDVDQVLRDPRRGELGQGAGLGVEAGARAVLDADPHHLDGAQRRGVVAAGLLQGLLARLVEEHLAAERVLLEQQLLESMPPLVLPRPAGLLAGEVAHVVEEAGVGDQGVDQAELQGLAAGDRLAGEDQVERLGDADQPRQAGRAAPAGEDAQPHLGQADAGGRRVARHAAGRGERDLGAAAQADAADRGHGGEGERLPGREQAMAEARARLGLGGVGDPGDLLEVGAGDEAPRLAGEQDQAADVRAAARAPG